MQQGKKGRKKEIKQNRDNRKTNSIIIRKSNIKSRYNRKHQFYYYP
jgi:hypothetical protein